MQHKQTRELYALKYINKAKCVKMKAVANIIQERRLLEEVCYPSQLLTYRLSHRIPIASISSSDRSCLRCESPLRIPGRRELLFRIGSHAGR